MPCHVAPPRPRFPPNGLVTAARRGSNAAAGTAHGKGANGMSYSVRTAAESAAATIQEDWGSLTWLASAPLGNAANMTVGRVVIRKGKSNPRHCHANCHEVLYLLAGTLEHTMGEKVTTLNPGDTLVVASNVPHNARSIGDVDADMIVVYDSGRRDFRKE
jgi:quercetin dioxygenase-like cupin family protein